MYLVVGLGNPGENYKYTRHNLGFLVLDQVAEDYSISFDQIGFRARWGKGALDGSPVVLAKPTTYVNASGESVKALLDFFRLTPTHLVVVHDDLDLSLGTVKTKKGGSSAGHRGVESIIRAVGAEDFYRIRIGIGRPSGRKDPAEFVLEPFQKKELEEMSLAVVKAAEATAKMIGEIVDTD